MVAGERQQPDPQHHTRPQPPPPARLGESAAEGVGEGWAGHGGQYTEGGRRAGRGWDERDGGGMGGFPCVPMDLSYTVHMGKTITVRTDDSLRRQLEERAAVSGKTLSEVVREILEEAFAYRPLGERTGHMRGSLDLSSPGDDDPWRQRLRERNWRS